MGSAIPHISLRLYIRGQNRTKVYMSKMPARRIGQAFVSGLLGYINLLVAVSGKTTAGVNSRASSGVIRA